MFWIVGFAWLGGFALLALRANRRFRAYINAVALATSNESATDANRRTLREGSITAPFAVVGTSLGALLKHAPSAQLEMQRKSVTRAYRDAYAYIPLAIVPMLLVASILHAMFPQADAGWAVPTVWPAIDLAICVIVGVAIVLHVRHQDARLSIGQSAAVIVGIIGIAVAGAILLAGMT